ncbi:cytochrome P450 [Tirmania nivea]|nr:cytochrome P450 [Tirmania nivea]
MAILTSSILSRLSPAELAGILIILCALKVTFSLYRHDPNPSKLPVVGIPPGLFGRIRAIPACLTQYNSIIADGYLRYHKQKNPTAFVAPWVLSNYIHIIPPHLIPEHKSAPENVLSQVAAFQGENGNQAIGGREIFTHMYHVPIIRQKLTASLAKMLDPMVEELEMSFKEEWEQPWMQTKDAEGWVEMRIFEETMKIVSRTSNRVFGGVVICRDKAFLKNAIDFAVGVVMAGYGVQLAPKKMRWLVEPLVSIRNRRRLAFAARKLTPIIEERRAIIERNSRDESNTLEEPDDLLQYLIHEAINLGPPHDSVYQLACRYLVVNFVAIHTTSLGFSNNVANMAAYTDPTTGRSYWDILREEVEAVDRVSEEGPGVWTKRKLNKLVGLDSFIRETLRKNISGAVGMVRKVMPKEGHTYSNGLHVNHGQLIGVPTLSMHNDDDSTGQQALDFIGFRYSRPYQELSAEAAADTSATGGVGKLAAVTTADHYLSFGHGKHACPGRFFGVIEIKMLLNYCLLNYEIQSTERAPPQFVLANQAPPFNIVIKMRKR